MKRKLRLLTTSLIAAAALAGCGGGGKSSSTNPAAWSMLNGSTAQNSPGTYGTQGSASKANIPGARSYAASWTDTSGNLWLFGGIGYDANATLGELNDLWEYSNGQWTWITGSSTSPGPVVPRAGDAQLYGNIGAHGAYGTLGVSAAVNTPGARGSAMHTTDTNGNLWLFGGFGVDASGNWTALNDLWKFSPASGQWTWMSGYSTVPTTPKGVYGTPNVASTANFPGPRSNGALWTDTQGNLWLFGGYGYDASGNDGFLDDIWEYSNGQWTWVSGSKFANPSYAFYQQGSASTAATPGGRAHMAIWIDSHDDLWIYGGQSQSLSNVNNWNTWSDLWKFSPSSGLWTWVGGSSQPNQSTSFGQMGVAATSNTPGSRLDAASWTDANGNLWLFGGSVQNGSMPPPIYPDLWEYSSGQWTWVGGSQCPCGYAYSQAGIQGPQGPGIRAGAATWVNSLGQFVLFGGDTPGPGAVIDSTTPIPNTDLNDLWEFTP